MSSFTRTWRPICISELDTCYDPHVFSAALALLLSRVCLSRGPLSSIRQFWAWFWFALHHCFKSGSCYQQDDWCQREAKVGEADLMHFALQGGIKFCFPTFTFGYRQAVASLAKGNSWRKAIWGAKCGYVFFCLWICRLFVTWLWFCIQGKKMIQQFKGGWATLKITCF